MQNFKVSGHAVLDGNKVLLALEPENQADPVRTNSAPPNCEEFAQSIVQRTPCHPSRLPVTVAEIRVMIYNVQTQLNLRSAPEKWSDIAQDRLMRFLAKPKQQRRGISPKAINVSPKALANEEEMDHVDTRGSKAGGKEPMS